ncbi:MAG TPA: ATP-binding protein [Bacteroidia bacterium]|jgi:serine/threonine-protein kinase RsbW|nr:ATP-binding protein [Bacteroidia bacterium]
MVPAKGESLKISSDPQNLRLVEKLIDDVCQIYNVNQDCYGNILIAVTEAVNNAISHGNNNNPSKKVSIGFESDEKQLTFKIEDEGPGFDYQNLPDPTDPANLEKINGRGVFLMKNLADKIEFHNNGTQVSLSFYN